MIRNSIRSDRGVWLNEKFNIFFCFIKSFRFLKIPCIFITNSEYSCRRCKQFHKLSTYENRFIQIVITYAIKKQYQFHEMFEEIAITNRR